jgi:cell division protein FtsI (penicillin-binding protein 3)
VTRVSEHDLERQPLPARRIALLLTIVLIAVAAVGVRTLYVQLVEGPSLSKRADGQHQLATDLPAVRGDILDRNGQELAVGEEAVTFYVTPKFMKDPTATAVEAARLLKLKRKDKEVLLARLVDAKASGSGFAYVARQVPQRRARVLIDQVTQELSPDMPAEEQARVKRERDILKGIGWYNEERRIYPLQSVGAQVLGGVNVDNKGIAGIEMLYEGSLAGVSGKQVIVRDPTGIPLDVLSLKRERDGKSVRLTIDATIQTEVERVLAETMKRFSAKGATAIVMNPRTGEILAMASAPAINANTFGNSNSSWQRNRAITDTFEPGSTFKIVTISAALEEGLVTPTTSFLLTNRLRVADRWLEDAEERPTDRMDVREILVKSSNIGTVTIGKMLGKEGIDRWNRRFGFGQLTGIDFPGEVPGLMLAPEDWSGSTIGNVPIGQGIGVTGIQMVSAFAAIANDGILIKPHLIKQVGNEPPATYPRRRIISRSTARIMQSMFGQVVSDEHGTGGQAAIPGYAVAGKTGTANKADKGVYVKGKYVASFIGFVPARNPQLLTFVAVDEPNVPWGGSVAAPAFEKISEFALQYLAIPPDGVL